MRWTRLLVLPVLVVLLVACGGSPGTSTDDNGNGNGNGESTNPDVTATAEASKDDGNGTGNDGDVEQLAADLVPPNSTETTRTVASGVVFAGYESTDSADSLKSYYEGKIASAGMVIISTTSTSGTYGFIFAEDDQGSGFGGSIAIAPSSSGGSGSTVVVTVALSD
jgi:hypothetical protein